MTQLSTETEAFSNKALQQQEIKELILYQAVNEGISNENSTRLYQYILELQTKVMTAEQERDELLDAFRNLEMFVRTVTTKKEDYLP